MQVLSLREAARLHLEWGVLSSTVSGRSAYFWRCVLAANGLRLNSFPVEDT